MLRKITAHEISDFTKPHKFVPGNIGSDSSLHATHSASSQAHNYQTHATYAKWTDNMYRNVKFKNTITESNSKTVLSEKTIE